MRLAFLTCLLPLPALADPADIVAVTATRTGEAWRFAVTLAHADTGWDDYADGWRVELPDGTVLATRTLFHPHVDEQPFTRSLGGVEIPEDVHEVTIRASTNVEGWADTTRSVPLP
ncbi:MAG: hypothetical protein NXH79_05215 [Rhodobacteraceae bacterium]|nr:hypothetical protein [Paracoccaceae bacterium]